MVRLWKEMEQGKCGLGLGKKEGGQGKGRKGEGEGRPARPCDPTRTYELSHSKLL